MPATSQLNPFIPSCRSFITLFFCTCTLYVFIQCAGATAITTDIAKNVAENFLNHLNTTHHINTITSVQSSGQHVGYLITLNPQGYILVAGDNIRVPVKAYSLSTMFDALPEAYTFSLLRELEIPVSIQLKQSISPSEDVNRAFWDYLKQPAPVAMLKSYTPDTYLLTSQWGQSYPYNKLNPLVGEANTVTGCTQTAVAQLMRYHEHPTTGNGVFTQTWDGQTLTAVMNRAFNWELMPDAASAGESYQQDEIAALMRDLGVMNNADYGLSSTSTSFDTVRFARSLGYAPVSNMSISDSNFFTTIQEEIDNLRPVLLRLPGHLTVADGYSSNLTGKEIHINLGWEGAYDDYYFLDETIYTEPYNFPPDHSIFYNLKPCEGEECQDSYPPAVNNISPEITIPLDDIATYDTFNIRVDGRDRDGDSVIFSASTSCDGLQAVMNRNILTLNPTIADIYCQVTVFAQSHDGSTADTFNVLIVEEGIHLGPQLDMNGQFSNQSEQNEYTVYLNGYTTISGNRGYSNQAFYVWIKDDNNNLIVAATDDTIAETFTPGYYTLTASLSSPSGSYYTYDVDYSNYILGVSTNTSIAGMASDMGIEQSRCIFALNLSGDGSGSIVSLPVGIGCGDTCSESFVCGSDILLTASADSGSLFTGWSGDCSGSTSTLMVGLDEDKSCTATFNLPYNISTVISPIGGGSVSCTPNPVEHGSSSSCTIVTNTGYVLDTVSGTCGGTRDEAIYTTDVIIEECTVAVNFLLPGDINRDSFVNLSDAIIALQIVANIMPTGSIAISADINDDDKIGIEEAIHALRQIAWF